MLSFEIENTSILAASYIRSNEKCQEIKDLCLNQGNLSPLNPCWMLEKYKMPKYCKERLNRNKNIKNKNKI